MIRRFFDREGSTRSVGLLRIALALLCWSAFANLLQPFRDTSAQHWLIGAAFFVSTTLLLVGLASRVASAGTAATLSYMFLHMGVNQRQEEYTHHHTTLLITATCLLALTPCGGSFSADRWLANRSADRAGVPRPPERGPLWALPLFGIQLSAVYFYGAWEKTSWPFLSGARMEHHLMGYYLGSDPLAPWLAWLMLAAAVITVVMEYALTFTFWIPRLRAPSIVVGLALHAAFYYLIPVATFSLTVMAMYIAWLDPDALHAWIDDLLDVRPRAS